MVYIWDALSWTNPTIREMEWLNVLSFKVNVLVANADADMITAAREQSRLAHVSRNGTLVVPLVNNYEMSYANYPSEWTDTQTDDISLFRLHPNFASGSVHEAYELPPVLAGSTYRLMLQVVESNSRGSYCQIATGYNGERLYPYRREGRRHNLGWGVAKEHPTSSVFSAPAMGVVRIDANRTYSQAHVRIRRAAVEVTNDLVTVTHEQLLSINHPKLVYAKLTSLTDELKDWEPALHACYERRDCALTACSGHYHL